MSVRAQVSLCMDVLLSLGEMPLPCFRTMCSKCPVLAVLYIRQ